MVEVYFSLGSDIGDRESNLNKALAMMDEAFGCHYDAVSDFIETDPWGFVSDSRFMNCAVRYSLHQDCFEILDLCQDIEKRMGRSPHSPEYDRNGKRVYRSRIIDIDILLYGEERIDTDRLKVPHPLMTERDFVMIPLKQILSDKGLIRTFGVQKLQEETGMPDLR